MIRSILTSSVPMIPASIIGVLSVIRLGAIHAIVFGGFAPASLAQRIEASKPRIILTASCGIEGTKGPISYKPFIQKGVAKSKHKPETILVWQRKEALWQPLSDSNGEKDWQRLVADAKQRKAKAAAIPVQGNDPLYIIYTSGKPAVSEPKMVHSLVHAITNTFRNDWTSERRGARRRRARSGSESIYTVYFWDSRARRCHVLCLR